MTLQPGICRRLNGGHVLVRVRSLHHRPKLSRRFCGKTAPVLQAHPPVARLFRRFRVSADGIGGDGYGLFPCPVGGQMINFHKVLAGENRLPVLPGERVICNKGGSTDVSILRNVQHIAVLRRPGAQQ